MQKSTLTFALMAAAAVFVTSTFLGAPEKADRIESAFVRSSAYRTHLKDAHIKARSTNGIVTLTGLVKDASQKHLAEEAVAAIPGVQRVDNRLEVTLEGAADSDARIGAEVRSVLALHHNVVGSSTQVDIRDGVVTLFGTAKTEAEKTLTTTFAAEINGARSVVNNMTLTPMASDLGIRPERPRNLRVVSTH